MVRSMTGFGRGEKSFGDCKITVEMKSVNNRYLDLSMKMPKKFYPFESQIRAEVKKYLQRGKVDIFISFEDKSSADVSVQYNKAIAAAYMNHFKQMADDFGIDNDIRVSTLARFPEVFSTADVRDDEDTLWDELKITLDEALEKMVEAREKEGEFLKQDLLEKLAKMQSIQEFILDRAPSLVSAYRERLTAKVRELLGNTTLDEQRILQEVTIYADKICVDEELVRLASHIKTTREALEKGQDGIGRRLDFLAQEMNREANTILSKTDDVEISDKGVDLKTEIERVREQIQNIE